MKISIRYGIICGLLVCSWIMSEFMLGLHNEYIAASKYTDPVVILIVAVMIYIALKERRFEEPSKAGFIPLAGTGILMMGVSAMVISSFFLAYTNYINPEWEHSVFAMQAESLMQQNASMDEIAAAAHNFEIYTQDSTSFSLVFGSVFLLGTILSVLCSAILRTNSKLHQ